MTDLTKHMTPKQQREFIARQQDVNAGLAASEAAYARGQRDRAQQGGNTLVARREGQEAKIADEFAGWRRHDAETEVAAPRRYPHPPGRR
jgi:hypothetical protein